MLTTLKKANLKFSKNYPGDSLNRQPVHTVYGGAHLYTAETNKKLASLALKSFETHVKNSQMLAQICGESYGDGKLWDNVYARVQSKLKNEAIEDFRLDFEDGYGYRDDLEEDNHATEKAIELARALKENTLPPFIGIRIKPFNQDGVTRSIRTLNLFISTLIKNSNKKLPKNFVITLPKVQIKEQVITFEKVLNNLEKKLKLKKGILKCELMIELPQSLIDEKGNVPLRTFVLATKGRCTGVHFGTYDYTAACNITANYQTMNHEVCTFAKNLIQVSLAGLPVFLSDGATNVIPVGNSDEVYAAWNLSYKNIRHSLKTGYYQGWDLHPAQIPIRYVALYAFFLESYEPSLKRLKNFIERAAKATLSGLIFDDAASAQGLLNYFLKGYYSGALTQGELNATGMKLEDLKTKSFLKILGY